MLRRFAKTALVGLLLVGASCQGFTWTGRTGQVDAEATARGVKDVRSLERDYDTQRFWSKQRQNMNGRIDAFWNGLDRIVESVDRHGFNYSRPGLSY